MAAVRSDPAALEELYRRHRRQVMNYAARRCSQPADVADLVAATFMAVLLSASTYDPGRGDVIPWIIGVAHRQHGSMLRRERRQGALAARSANRRVLSDDDIARVEEQIDAARRTPAVETALHILSAPQREAMWLVGHDGLTPQEAARVVGIPSAALRLRLSRARHTLRHALRETDDAEDTDADTDTDTADDTRDSTPQPKEAPL